METARASEGPKTRLAVQTTPRIFLAVFLANSFIVHRAAGSPVTLVLQRGYASNVDLRRCATYPVYCVIPLKESVGLTLDNQTDLSIVWYERLMLSSACNAIPT